MSRLLTVRLALVFFGLAIWAYGKVAGVSATRVEGMAILVVALLLRFLPARWLGDD